MAVTIYTVEILPRSEWGRWYSDKTGRRFDCVEVSKKTVDNELKLAFLVVIGDLNEGFKLPNLLRTIRKDECQIINKQNVENAALWNYIRNYSFG